MARVEIPITVAVPGTGGDLEAVLGASVTVRKRSDNSLATIFQAETGSTTTSNPLSTDVNGRVTGWVDRGAYKLTVAGSGIMTYDEPFDAAPAGDGSADLSWLAGAVVPIGAIFPCAAPGDASVSWLSCDGRALSRSTYAVLFAAIGTAYGPGDGSTTFNLPDMRGRVPVGVGTGTGGGASGAAGTKPTGGVALSARSLGAWAGEENHLLLAAESGVNGSGSGTFQGESLGNAGSSVVPHFTRNASLDATFEGVPFNSRDADSGHNTMQPSIVLNFIIRAL